MKRWIWIALAALVVVAVGVTLVAVPRGPEWTTSSPEALAEFEAGTDAQNKVYYAEAQEHFGRAYEIDPDFVMAKWRYAGALYDDDHERAEALFEELMTVDTSKLTTRETFLIERWRANRDGRSDDAARLVDEYHTKYPTDPYILRIRANGAWNRGELEEAERLFQHLLTVDPNYVVAYNSLGYISMMRGRFTESEEHFKSYRYIAPDQANPHDSLGELFITTGRYGEAEVSLETAIEIKPDFWASYTHLAIMNAYTGNAQGTRAVIERARATGMPESMVFEMECRALYSEMADREAWRQILDERNSECVTGFKSGYAVVVTHRAACRVGDWETVQAIEDEAAGYLLETEGNGNGDDAATLRAVIHHMQGVRLASRGDFPAAAERFRAADDRLSFMQVNTGMFKLLNRMFLVETMLADRDLGLQAPGARAGVAEAILRCGGLRGPFGPTNREMTTRAFLRSLSLSESLSLSTDPVPIRPFDSDTDSDTDSEPAGSIFLTWNFPMSLEGMTFLADESGESRVFSSASERLPQPPDVLRAGSAASPEEPRAGFVPKPGRIGKGRRIGRPRPVLALGIP